MRNSSSFARITELAPESPYAEEEDIETPERKLLRAYLDRGLRDALALSDRDKEDPKVQRKAIEWALDPSLRPFGFIWTCVLLDISEAMQATLRNIIRNPGPYAHQLKARLDRGQGILV